MRRQIMNDNYITKELRKDFPNLTYWNSKQTSKASRIYNCITWALGMNNCWIWPDSVYDIYTWPYNLPRVLNKTIFIKLFGHYEYKIIPDMDISIQEHIQKIAIYANTLGLPTHAARQLRNGYWTSKLGIDMDIEHDTLEVLEGPAYGSVYVIMGKLASWPRYIREK
jgi:hypothetical protein